MFPVYAIGNIALLVLGHESGTARSLPQWGIWAVAVIIALLMAFQASRSLARAYYREDRTLEIFSRFQRG
jgi:hypothetical protein